MEKKNLPVGIEFYKKIIDEAYYYVDKTLMIKELLDRQSYVSLFTRPRRFGKTLALDMLKTFFEKELDEVGNVLDNRHYFDGMKIMSAVSCDISFPEIHKAGRYGYGSLDAEEADCGGIYPASICFVF